MENTLRSPKSTSKNVLLSYLTRILELREVSSTLAHPELLSSLTACFQHDLQSGILRLFQIKCLIHGNTSTNKALGKEREKKLSTIPLDGRGKQNLEQHRHGLSGHSNAPTHSSAVGEGGAALTHWWLDYRLAPEVSQLCSDEEAGEEEGSLYSRPVWLCCSSSFPPALQL